MMRLGVSLWLLLASTAAAQPVIKDVVNAASRIGSGLPNYGIAQGSLFAVTGAGLGPDVLQQAGFPLPSTDGLAGVTVQVTVGDTTVNALMAYASGTEVGAILPSATPLGTGTVTLNNNGAVATAPLTVVASAFGAFALGYQAGTGQAAAFNLNADGTVSPNGWAQPAQPGQTLLLNGTGLGAISSDETLSGATDAVNPGVQVWVGNASATVVSAGRGTCCTGLPDGFPAPQGIAAWDVIQFTVPDGTDGCQVSVIVQNGNYASNYVTIAVAAAGAPCTYPGAAGDTITISGPVKMGQVNLMRVVTRASLGGLTSEIASESGTANFYGYDAGPVPVTAPIASYRTLANNLAPGSCWVQTASTVIPASAPPPSPPPTNSVTVLDAGPVININGPHGAKVLKKTKDGSYSGALGTSFSLPGLPSSSSLYLDPGAFKADNGAGGADIPAFTGNLTLPATLVFANADQIAAMDRTQGVTVTWTGGDPNGFVTVIGTSYSTSGNLSLTGEFGCSERVSAGQLTVPAFITLALPVTGVSGNTPTGTIGLATYSSNTIPISGVNLALFNYELISSKAVGYQ